MIFVKDYLRYWDEYKIKEFAVSNNSFAVQIYTLISFNYEGCVFGEHFTEDKHYLYVKMLYV